MINKSCVL